MRRVVLHTLTALGAAALASCAGASAGTPATTLTRIGEVVQITENPIRARECEFISDLAVRSSSPDDADALRALRNDAGAAGANLVLLVMAARTIERAEGYLCADE